MSVVNRKKIIRLLGVGFDAEDGHIRITHGDEMDVFMGSEESHENIVNLINIINSKINEKGLKLRDLSINEFIEFLETIL